MGRGIIIATLCLLIALLLPVWIDSTALKLSALKWPRDSKAAESPTIIDAHNYAFGIKFALDRVVSSVSLSNGSTYGLVQITGDEDYQSLMRRYLDICYKDHVAEGSPLNSEEKKSATWRYVGGSETDTFGEDAGVNILARAVDGLKEATEREMHRRFIVIGAFAWAHTSTVTPDFFWMTSDLEDPEIEIRNARGPDAWWDVVFMHGSAGSDDAWIRDTLQKFTAAIHRNRIGRDNPAIATLCTSPASFNTLSYTMWQQCCSSSAVSDLDDGICGSREPLLPAILVTFNNVSFSVWSQGHHILQTYWGTYLELGGHSIENCRDDMDCAFYHWGIATSKLDALIYSIESSQRLAIDALRENLNPKYKWKPGDDIEETAMDYGDGYAGCGNPDPRDDNMIMEDIRRGKEKAPSAIDSISNSRRSTINLVLAGDSWTESSLAMFSEHLEFSGLTKKLLVKKVIHQPDKFAASQRAARWSMKHPVMKAVSGLDSVKNVMAEEGQELNVFN